MYSRPSASLMIAPRPSTQIRRLVQRRMVQRMQQMRVIGGDGVAGDGHGHLCESLRLRIRRAQLKAICRVDSRVQHVPTRPRLAQKAAGEKGRDGDAEREMIIWSHLSLHGELASNVARATSSCATNKVDANPIEPVVNALTPIPRVVDRQRQSSAGSQPHAGRHVDRIRRTDEARAPRVGSSWKQRIERVQGRTVRPSIAGRESRTHRDPHGPRG